MNQNTKQSPDNARPRIVLADDHQPVLSAVSGLLQSAFNVVAAVTDGQLALDATLRLDPDVVVLDMTMPGLDGLQTALELKRRRTRARIVFLTMHHAEECVAAAIESGADGYVMKSRIFSDLPGALNHALAGRRFLPSLTSLQEVPGGMHAVQFYADEDVRLDELSRAAATALKHGDPVTVIGIDATRAGVEQRLTNVGLDVASLTAQGRYLVFDAADALSQILQDGRPDADSIAGFASDLERARLAVAEGSPSRMMVFGEMVVQLCRTGQVDAAVGLEQIWDDRTRTLPFLTVCAYPVDCFADQPGRTRIQDVCSAHSAVVHGPNIAPFA